MKFNCKPCNYSTDVKNCYEKHLKTKKHIGKVNMKQTETTILPNKFKCQNCDNCYTTAINLAIHQKQSLPRDELIKSYEDQLYNLKKELAFKNISLTKAIEYKETVIDENKTLRVLLSRVGNIAMTSMAKLNEPRQYKQIPLIAST